MAQTNPDLDRALVEIEEVLTRNLNVLAQGLLGIEDSEVMLGDWGVVYHVTDMIEAGSGWIDAHHAPHMHFHHWTGLLREALRQEEEPPEDD